MRMSSYVTATVRETPKETESVSHQLMIRAGLIRQTASGIYAWLPTGLRVLRRIENIVREEMDRAGAIECLLPLTQSADLWRESERYDAYGPEMLRFRDRHDREFLFGPTAEELFTAVFRECMASYRDLPRTLYQVQWKFRDEIRPRNGVMRAREFLMKDAYSFDINADGARESYEAMKVAYMAVFARLGLDAEIVAADSGPIGGSSHEFLVGGLEVGHIFSFGTRYSEKLGMRVNAADGSLVHPHMGSYGIGISRLIAAIIEVSNDRHGIIWPEEAAPFKRTIINLSPRDERARRACERLYDLTSDCLYDDRDERAGTKMADADLSGIPQQIIVGSRGIESRTYEIKNRATGERQTHSFLSLLDDFG